MISARDYLRKPKVERKADFMILLMLAKYLGMEGEQLDFSTIEIDERLYNEAGISKELLDYYYTLQSRGYAVPNQGIQPRNLIGRDIHDVDIEFIKDTPLYSEQGDTLLLSKDFMQEVYPDYVYKKMLTNMDYMACYLYIILAKHIYEVMQGIEERKLIIKFDQVLSASLDHLQQFVNITIANPWMKDYYELDYIESETKMDPSWKLYYNASLELQKIGQYTPEEKVQFMKQEGLKPGDIAALYGRVNISSHREWGDIGQAYLIEIQEITPEGMTFKKLTIPRTKEQTVKQFLELPAEKRHLYIDILEHKALTEIRKLGWYDLGVCNYFSNQVVGDKKSRYAVVPETYIVMPLDTETETELYVTIDHKEQDKGMLEIDAVYWLLKQYDMDFHEEQFLAKYFKGRTPLYNQVDPTPNEFSYEF